MSDASVIEAPPGSDRYLAESSHKYRGPSGLVWPSVTTITKLYDDGRSGAMAGAAAKITRSGGDYRCEWAQKTQTGTRVHGYVERWIKGETVDVPAADAPYLDAAEQWWHDYSPRWLHTERIVLWEDSSYGQQGYGGKFDGLAVIDGEVWIVDLKTGKPYPTEHAAQLAAYAWADGMACFSTEDGSLLPGLEPLPKVNKGACLYLAADGTYTWQPYPIGEQTFEFFLLLLRAWFGHRELATKCKETQ